MATAIESSHLRDRILVVDDDDDLRDVLATCLHMDGFDAHGARDGRSALDAIPRFEPALIILDVVMPGMSGHELRDRARAIPGLAKVKVVMMTATHDAETSARGDDVLLKPFELERLLSVVRAKLAG